VAGGVAQRFVQKVVRLGRHAVHLDVVAAAGASFQEAIGDGNVVRAFGLAAGLVDVKVCAVDATWSGLKLVFRLKDR